MFLRLAQCGSESQLPFYPTLQVYLPSLSFVFPKYLEGILNRGFFEIENYMNMINMLLLGFFFYRVSNP